jgi:hypothetical protein
VCSMWKVIIMVLVGAALVQATPPVGNGCAKEEAATPAAVHLEGKLDYDDSSGPRIPEAGVWVGPFMVVKGQWYGLDFAANKELAEKAKKLYGKRVLATGTLTMRDLPGGLEGFGQPVRVLLVEALDTAVGKDDAATWR